MNVFKKTMVINGENARKLRIERGFFVLFVKKCTQ